VGANCIYPIIGVGEYKWKFTGSEVDEAALQNARTIIDKNPLLHGMVDIRLQRDKSKVFHNVIQHNDSFHLSICNPPFHDSAEAALAGTERKWRNLSKFASNNSFDWIYMYCMRVLWYVRVNMYLLIQAVKEYGICVS